MSTTTFNDLTPFYEALINWPKRLAHETPFYRRWFAEANVQHLVDVACGTGHHAALFDSWGLQVQAADLSPNMIAAARTTHPNTHIDWQVRSFAQPINSSSTSGLHDATTSTHFDAALCIGNSLALAPDLATVETALQHMLHCLRPNGLLILHLLNLWSLPSGPCLWQKTIQSPPTPTHPQGTLIIKGVHRVDASPTPHGYVELLVITQDPANPTPQLQHESIRFLGLEAPNLEHLLRQAGTKNIQLFGGYQNQPYERETSPDLILIARK